MKSVNNLFIMEVSLIKFMFFCVLFVIIVEMYLFFAFERIRKYVDTRVETGIEVRIYRYSPIITLHHNHIAY